VGVRGSVKDWILVAKEKGIDLSCYDSDKNEDLKKLEKLDLPQDRSFSCSYYDFVETNRELMNFMNHYERFIVRAIPIPEKKDLPRKPQLNLKGFESCKRFAEEATKGNEQDYTIIISEFAQQIYGGVLIVGKRYVRGEIGKDLVNLCFGKDIPLGSFILDRRGLGHIEDKTIWFNGESGEEKDARKYLWRAFNHLRFGDDSFDPILYMGYFEFIVRTSGEIKFVDYKDNENYLSY